MHIRKNEDSSLIEVHGDDPRGKPTYLLPKEARRRAYLLTLAADGMPPGQWVNPVTATLPGSAMPLPVAYALAAELFLRACELDKERTMTATIDEADVPLAILLAQ